MESFAEFIQQQTDLTQTLNQALATVQQLQGQLESIKNIQHEELKDDVRRLSDEVTSLSSHIQAVIHKAST